MIRTIHKSRYVLVEPDMLLQNAAVHVCDPGRISRVEPWQGELGRLEAEVIDWGSAVILPGLVNAHTHLELTHLQDHLPPPSSFTGWLSEVVRRRRDWTPQDHVQSVQAGASLSLASGTTLVGDISASGVSAQALGGWKLRRVVFEEALSLAPEDASVIAASIEGRIDCEGEPALLSRGVSPHAPYSASAELYRSIGEIARRKKIPLATHLAETPAEIEFLRSGSGDMRDFLESLGVLPPGWRAPGLGPVAYMESIGLLEVAPILIHCNYLDSDAIAKILGQRCSVIYCPRSNAFFGHEKHPVRQLLDAGVNVALGTDSLASNSSLSVLDEMRFLFRERKDLKCDEILRMASLNGATALRFGGVLGRLRRGFWADMTILDVPGNVSSRNLAARILEGAGDCIATIVRGEVAWRKNG